MYDKLCVIFSVQTKPHIKNPYSYTTRRHFKVQWAKEIARSLLGSLSLDITELLAGGYVDELSALDGHEAASWRHKEGGGRVAHPDFLDVIRAVLWRSHVAAPRKNKQRSVSACISCNFFVHTYNLYFYTLDHNLTWWKVTMWLKMEPLA